MHFREGYELSVNAISSRGQSFEETIDIFEVIAQDDPKGAVQLTQGCGQFNARRVFV